MLFRLGQMSRVAAAPALALFTAASVALAAVLVIWLTVSAEEVQDAAEDALALASMRVALAEESQRAASWVTDRIRGVERLSLEQLTAGPAGRFETGAGRLLAGGGPPARADGYRDLQLDHDELLASIAELDRLDGTGRGIGGYYGMRHRSLEESLENDLLALEAAAATRLELAMLDTAAARDRLTTLLPVIVLATTAATYALWRLRLARRRADTLQVLIEEKDVFIGSVSHELRTPLTGILGMTEQLLEHGEDYTAEERREFQDLVFTQALEMRDLVEDLLVAARSSVDAVGIRLQDLELGDLVRRVLEESILMRSEEAPDVTIGEGTVRVRADRMRFRQILRNLLSNASRYGGERVRITFADRDRWGVVSVWDDGRGVESGMEQAIFEPYCSAAGTDRPVASVGIGLAVSRDLARLMGGDLTYRREGAETVFEVILPLASSAAHAGVDPLPSAAASLAT